MDPSTTYSSVCARPNINNIYIQNRLTVPSGPRSEIRLQLLCYKRLNARRRNPKHVTHRFLCPKSSTYNHQKYSLKRRTGPRIALLAWCNAHDAKRRNTKYHVVYARTIQAPKHSSVLRLQHKEVEDSRTSHILCKQPTKCSPLHLNQSTSTTYESHPSVPPQILGFLIPSNDEVGPAKQHGKETSNRLLAFCVKPKRTKIAITTYRYAQHGHTTLWSQSTLPSGKMESDNYLAKELLQRQHGQTASWPEEETTHRDPRARIAPRSTPPGG